MEFCLTILLLLLLLLLFVVISLFLLPYQGSIMTNQLLMVQDIGVTKETIVLSTVTDNFLTCLKPDLNHEPYGYYVC